MKYYRLAVERWRRKGPISNLSRRSWLTKRIGLACRISIKLKTIQWAWKESGKTGETIELIKTGFGFFTWTFSGLSIKHKSTVGSHFHLNSFLCLFPLFFFCLYLCVRVGSFSSLFSTPKKNFLFEFVALSYLKNKKGGLSSASPFQAPFSSKFPIKLISEFVFSKSKRGRVKNTISLFVFSHYEQATTFISLYEHM